MRKILSLLILSCAIACAQQYTITFSADSDSDGTYVYNSIAMEYAPGANCPMCPMASHTYTGSQLLQASNGDSNECTYSAFGTGNQYVSTGCEVAVPIDPNSDESFTGYSTAHNLCTVIGTFFAIVSAVAAPKVDKVKSGYKEDTCVPLSAVSWACAIHAFGFGCPTRCSTSTARIVGPGKPQGFEQCINILINNNCVQEYCVEQQGAGFCTQPPPN